MKKIYLHIGSPKTGSSALQSFLLENEKELSNLGICYPQHEVDINGISGGNGKEILLLIKEKKFKEAKNKIDNIISKCKYDNIIISSEAFYAYPKLTYQLFPDATIIVYFREQSSRIESGYNQNVKRTNETNSFAAVVNKTLTKDDVRISGEILKQWADLYSHDSFIIRPYEESQFHEGTIYTDFLTSLGFDYDYKNFFIPKKLINVSYTRDALEYRLILNRLILNKKPKFEKMIDKAAQSYSQKCSERNDIIYSLMTADEKKRIKKYYSEINIYIARSLLGRDNGKLFYDEGYNKNSKEYGGLTIRKIIELTKYITESSPDLIKYIVESVWLGLYSNQRIVKRSAVRLLPIFSIPQIYHFVKIIKDDRWGVKLVEE